jgi:hypothetical protein
MRSEKRISYILLLTTRVDLVDFRHKACGILRDPIGIGAGGKPCTNPFGGFVFISYP